MNDYTPAMADTFPAFAAYFGAALVLTALFVMIYIRTTPHNEFRLLVQIAGQFGARLLFPNLTTDIAAGKYLPSRPTIASMSPK